MMDVMNLGRSMKLDIAIGNLTNFTLSKANSVIKFAFT